MMYNDVARMLAREESILFEPLEECGITERQRLLDQDLDDVEFLCKIMARLGLIESVPVMDHILH